MVRYIVSIRHFLTLHSFRKTLFDPTLSSGTYVPVGSAYRYENFLNRRTGTRKTFFAYPLRKGYRFWGRGRVARFSRIATQKKKKVGVRDFVFVDFSRTAKKSHYPPDDKSRSLAKSASGRAVQTLRVAPDGPGKLSRRANFSRTGTRKKCQLAKLVDNSDDL